MEGAVALIEGGLERSERSLRRHHQRGQPSGIRELCCKVVAKTVGTMIGQGGDPRLAAGRFEKHVREYSPDVDLAMLVALAGADELPENGGQKTRGPKPSPHSGNAEASVRIGFLRSFPTPSRSAPRCPIDRLAMDLSVPSKG